MNSNIFNNTLNTFFNLCILFFDILLFTLFIIFICQDITYFMTNTLENLNHLFNSDCVVNSMNAGNSNPNTVSNTNTSIIHTNDGWAQGIKSIFIYGTGALRLSLLRAGGTPLQRSFVISSTLLADAASTALKNAINDPGYVESHIQSWRRIWNSSDSVSIDVSQDAETSKIVACVLPEGKHPDVTVAAQQAGKAMPSEGVNTNNLIPSSSTDGFSDGLMSWVVNHLKPILEPVSVDYSTELLANQIYGVSIILFILSIMILILLLSFIINIILFVYSDKILNYFTNKYIRWYISFNKKIIAIEIWFLGGSLLYFMYYLSYGIHFIATHPIIIK